MWHIRRGEVLTRRWSSRFYIGGDVGGAVAVRAPGFGDVFDATSSTSADTHGRRVRKSVPNYSSVSSSLAPNFTPDVPRFHVPANK